MPRVLVPCWFFIGCVDYAIHPPGDAQTSPSTPPAPIETCALRPAPPEPVELEPACQPRSTRPTDPWSARIAWQWEAGAHEGGVHSPAIGNLTDDDGDGRVTELDDPDVVFIAFPDGSTLDDARLVALDNRGHELFIGDGYLSDAGVAIADVDGDGWPEVISALSTRQVVALDNTGRTEWTSVGPSVWAIHPQVTVADLDNDGDAEVVFDHDVLDGATGTVVGGFYDPFSLHGSPVVADLDQDGLQQVIIGGHVLDSEGDLSWVSTSPSTFSFAAVADVDGDPEGEVLFVAMDIVTPGAAVYVADADGTDLGMFHVASRLGGPPSVADFDGDGQVEIAIAAQDAISVHELDGTLDWSVPVEQDTISLQGCSGFDVDGDGASEVLASGVDGFEIFDGATGDVRYRDPTTLGDMWSPIVVDLDHDLAAEIVVASADVNLGTFRGLRVYAHDGDGWPSTGATWPSVDFPGSIAPDGAVPANRPPSWQTGNLYRARPTEPVPGAADPSVALGAPCVTTCSPGGTAQIPYQVLNRGGADLAGAVVHLTTDRVGAAELDEDEVGLVEAGTSRGGLFEVDSAQLLGVDRLWVAVEVAGPDCAPGDTEASIPNPCR
ncbi:MAG: VCBS repeat-containing protein [Myxococcota bacterium]